MYFDLTHPNRDQSDSVFLKKRCQQNVAKSSFSESQLVRLFSLVRTGLTQCEMSRNEKKKKLQKACYSKNCGNATPSPRETYSHPDGLGSFERGFYFFFSDFIF